MPTGAAAARLGAGGTARGVPLVRDETGSVLVGAARITGPDGGPLVGEAYADDDRVFTGEIEALTVRPSPAMPGVRATAGRRRGVLRRLEWFDARAVQLGTDGGLVTRDGVTGRRPVATRTASTSRIWAAPPAGSKVRWTPFSSNAAPVTFVPSRKIMP